MFEDLGAKVEEADSVRVAGFNIDALLDVSLDDSLVRFAIEAKNRAPYPGEVHALEPIRGRLATVGVPLLVVPYVSRPTGAALSEANWSWADAEGNADVRARGIRIQRRVRSRPPQRNRPELPRGSGSWAIIRSLILNGRADGASVTADLAGVSQPRSSQVLAQLTDSGYLERAGRSEWTADREKLLAGC